MACFANPVTQEYLEDALQGHMNASGWTWTNVNGAPGGVDKVETQVVCARSQGAKLLPPQLVSVVFRYQFHRAATG